MNKSKSKDNKKVRQQIRTMRELLHENWDGIHEPAHEWCI